MKPKTIKIFGDTPFGYYFIGLTGEFLIYTPNFVYLYVDRKKEKTKGWVKMLLKSNKDHGKVREAIFMTGEKLMELV